MRDFIIDTDCGIDDAVAIMMALAHPDVRVVGITAVSGNIGMEQVTENVLRLLSYFGRSDITVYRGASHALLQRPVRASWVHGENGLGGVELPPSRCEAAPEPAPVGMRDVLRAHPEATLVTLGPLTNLAMTLNLYPEVASHIGRLVTMGGAMETGNVTRFAEFNFYADPEAMQFVLDTGLPIELVPWDACLEHEFGPEDLDALGLEPSRASDLFFRLQDFVLGRSEHVYGRRFARHPDPLAMAYALDPAVATRVALTGLTMELGRTTLRGAGVRTDGEQVKAVMSIDRERYADVLRRIATL